MAGLRSVDLAEVRVVRGGGSVANGPGALAGTIDMISRVGPGIAGEIDGGSRNSLEARGRAGVDAWRSGVLSLSGRFERGDGFVPVTADTRGPADEPAPYRGWSARGRWVAPIGGSTRTAGKPLRLPRLADARHRLQRETAPTVPMRRCGWSAAGDGNGARSATGNGAT